MKMKAKNEKKLSGIVLERVARKLTKGINNYQRVFYFSRGQLYSWTKYYYTVGQYGNFGFCGNGAKNAKNNPGYIFIE